MNIFHLMSKRAKIYFSVTNIVLASLILVPAARPSEPSFFTKSPRLLKVTTTYSEVSVRIAKYYITIDLPANVGLPLRTVTVEQREGFETIYFEPEKTFAFLGTKERRGAALTIAQVDYNPQDKNTISVTFEPPIPPGNTFTLGLKPEQNPDYDGIYLLGITAYPAGDNPYGLYLGVGRLQFYRNGFIMGDEVTVFGLGTVSHPLRVELVDMAEQ